MVQKDREADGGMGLCVLRAGAAKILCHPIEELVPAECRRDSVRHGLNEGLQDLLAILRPLNTGLFQDIPQLELELHFQAEVIWPSPHPMMSTGRLLPKPLDDFALVQHSTVFAPRRSTRGPEDEGCRGRPRID